MVPTYGLTHLALAVRDPERSLSFYAEVFGLRATHRDAGVIMAETPGAKDVVAFEKAGDEAEVGRPGGVRHFGFRLIDPVDIDRAVEEAVRAGGRLLRRGEFSPGFPFAYVADPDGYEIEIWFE